MQPDIVVLTFCLGKEIADAAKKYGSYDVFFHDFLDNNVPDTTKIDCA